MKRKDRPAAPQPLATSTAERLEAIVEAAERAAVSVIDDAEKQARQQLQEAEAEAGRIVADRLASIEDLTESLVAQAEAIRAQAERLVDSLEDAKRRLGGDGEPASEASMPFRASHLAAVEEPSEPESAPTAGSDGQGTPAGARLLATQMAVSGNSREEIEERLRKGFEIEDTTAILDAILGPEE